MILFLQDWEKYPEAIIHTTTTNTSWVRLSGLYKQMGVKNHAFLLALHDASLLNVDPWSDNLTQEEIIKIATECKINPFYFFREVVRFSATGTDTGAPFRANRGNIATIWLFFNHITTLLIQPRQTGKTATMSNLTGYILGLAGINLELFLLTKDDSLRMKSVQDIKDVLENLPWYLYIKKRSDVYNTEQITINDLGNVYRTAVAQDSVRRANNVGRGYSIACTFIDEFAFIKNIDISLPVLLSAGTHARQVAKTNGGFYGTMFTTTAGYLSTPEGTYAYNVYKECLPWSEKLFDCLDEDDLVNTIIKNSPSNKPYVLCEFNHRQLGYTDLWLKETIQAAMADEAKVSTEFLNKWESGNMSSPIPRDLLKIINDSVINEPNIQVTTYGYIIRWYVSQNEIDTKCRNRYLVMGLDTSDVVGNDDTAMCIRDASTGEVVGVGVYNETNLITFANWLVSFLEEYPNITLIIERKSSGVTIIDNLLLLLPRMGIDPFRRIFNWVTNDAESNKVYADIINTPLSARDPSVYIKYKKEFGYSTAAIGRSARDNLYGLAFNASIKYTAALTRDKTLIGQLNGLIRKNDRIDHRPGEHDDLVIGYLLGYFLLTQAKNLKTYGIPPSVVLINVTTAMIDEEGGIEAIQNREYQTHLLHRINEMLDRLKEEENDYKANILIQQIKMLSRELNEDTRNKFNIESLIESTNRVKYFKNRRINYVI